MFAESLPKNCPPSDAKDEKFEEIYRLVSSAKPPPQEFMSHAARQIENKFNKDPCSWASCSLVKDPKEQLRRWPRMRHSYPYAAKLIIPSGSGKSKSKASSNHVDFWRYANFDITAAVVTIFLVPQEETDRG